VRATSLVRGLAKRDAKSPLPPLLLVVSIASSTETPTRRANGIWLKLFLAASLRTVLQTVLQTKTVLMVNVVAPVLGLAQFSIASGQSQEVEEAPALRRKKVASVTDSRTWQLEELWPRLERLSMTGLSKTDQNPEVVATDVAPLAAHLTTVMCHRATADAT